MASKIEAALVAATGLKEKDGEDRQKRLGRLLHKAQELTDKVWAKLDGDAQDWVNVATAKLNKKKPIPEFPDMEADDDDDDDDDADEKPAKRVKKAAAEDDDSDGDDDDDDDDDDDEDEKPAKKKSKKSEDDDDDDSDDDDEDEKPAKKKVKAAADDDDDDDSDDDDDDEPAAKKKSKKSADDDDDDDDEDADEKPAKRERDPNAKKGGVAAIVKLACNHMDWSKEKIAKKIEKQGYDVSPSTVSIQYYGAHKIMKQLAAAGHLKGYPQEAEAADED